MSNRKMRGLILLVCYSCHVFAGCLTEKGEDSLRKTCSSRMHTVRLDVSQHESVLEAYNSVRALLPNGKGNKYHLPCHSAHYLYLLVLQWSELLSFPIMYEFTCSKLCYKTCRAYAKFNISLLLSGGLTISL